MFCDQWHAYSHPEPHTKSYIAIDQFIASGLLYTACDKILLCNSSEEVA